MELLYDRSAALGKTVPLDFHRYLYDDIPWDDRLIAILGSRGVGKTTMMLQHMVEHYSGKEAIYVSADDIYFSRNSLFEFAEYFYRHGGKRIYIDEIHRYEGWSQEIKNIYDLVPGLKVVYSGSSVLELERGGADLSRRRLDFQLYGLSMREYAELFHGIRVPKVTLQDIVDGGVEIPTDFQPLVIFKEYLEKGYYPFSSSPMFYKRITGIVNTILELDIPQALKLTASTVKKLKKLLYIVSESAPFKPNASKISRDLGFGRNDVTDLFSIMEKASLITQLRDDTHGISALGKVDKIYLDNTTMMYAIASDLPNLGNVRETFFLQSVRPVEEVIASRQSDFYIKGMTFEVGGRNKTREQLKGLDNAFVVKDDVIVTSPGTLPLWQFGLLY